MKLPNVVRAVVEIEKLRDYCLSQTHLRGKHKAFVFESVLGLTTSDAEELREAILTAAQIHDATPTEKDEYGQRYIVDFPMERHGRQAIIRSSWIVRTNEDFPRLTSCYVL